MISGKVFNEKYGHIKFVKLTNESCIHNSFKFKTGLNEDIYFHSIHHHDVNQEDCIFVNMNVLHTG